MSDTHWGAGQGGMAPERLQSYVDELVTSHRTKSEIEDELMQHGLDR